MAIQPEISGPCKVLFSEDDSTFVELGFTTNENLVQFRVTDFNQPVTATSHGQEPIELIGAGRVVTIQGVLSTWDRTNVATLLEGAGSSTEGTAGVIGSRKIAQSRNIWSVAIEPVDIADGTGGTIYNPGYRFRRCYADGESLQMIDFGVNNKKLAFTFTALRQGSSFSAYSDGSSTTQANYEKYTSTLLS